jgi:hypothetical protein
MRAFERTFVALAALACLTSAAAIPALAQDAGQQAEEPRWVQGELLGVDTENGTLTVRTSADTELKFHYTEDTEVTGAQEGMAGLATIDGSTVTVYYVTDGDRHTAVKIEVQSTS